MWVRFGRDFDFAPEPRWRVAYRAGQWLAVPRAHGLAARAAGAALATATPPLAVRETLAANGWIWPDDDPPVRPPADKAWA